MKRAEKILLVTACILTISASAGAAETKYETFGGQVTYQNAHALLVYALGIEADVRVGEATLIYLTPKEALVGRKGYGEAMRRGYFQKFDYIYITTPGGAFGSGVTATALYVYNPLRMPR